MSNARLIGGSARIKHLRDGKVLRMDGTARIDWMDGTARIDWMDGTARIDRMDGTARIDRMTGTARIDWMDGTATAHASGEALVIVRDREPTVTVRGRASVLDYRPVRPAHHVADDGQVLTLAPGGTTSQAPVAQDGVR